MKIHQILPLLIALASAMPADAAKWFVKVDGSATTAGTTWAGAWNLATLNARLADGTVAEGDEIYFAGGLYRSKATEAEITITHKHLTLRGGYPPDSRVNLTPELDYPTDTPTIFTGDANGSGEPDVYDVRNIFRIDGSADPAAARRIVIEGFTLQSCFYDGDKAYESGAVCAELARGVELRHCIIEGNRTMAGGGAGLSVSGSAVHVADCIFTANRAGDAGAAIRATPRTGAGGAVYDPLLIVERSTLDGNELTASDAYPDGDAPEVLYNGIVLPATWPPKNLSPQSREPMPVPYLEEENIPAVIPVNVGRQLFVDDFLIASMTGLERIWHRPVKYSGNPILDVETELEQNSGGNPGASAKDGGVYWDQQQGLFRMWYEAGWLNTLALATSRDGIRWERPYLGVGRHNEILPGYPVNSSGVVVDYLAPPYERYKIYFRPANAKSVNSTGYAAISADGIHWTNVIASGASGDRSTMFFNPFRRKYVFSLRNGGGLNQAPHGRCRYYRESSHFLSGADWSTRNAVYWCGADNLDEPDPAVGIPPELYNVQAVAYESVMLGMLQIFLGPQNADCQARGIPKRTDLKVAFSRDGFHWSRPADRTSFIPSSGGSAWDKGYVQSVGGVCSVVGDQLRFYYIGFRGDETRPGTGYGMHAWGKTGMAVLRRDGFCSLTGTGSVTTRPLSFDGSCLFVNADATGGSVCAELLDEQGRPVEGFTADDCVPVTTDSTIARITWAGGDTLDAFAGRAIRLRFAVDGGASLYSFWISPSERGESRGYVAGGGPGYHTDLDTEGIDAYQQAKSYQINP
ncbi:MAG: hypothetical protein NC406_05645 [Bacteroides sp.]|nr:hypothetical protein [Bacteroides sp.]MCM1095214.1 hypothetical protein [Terasakiella sp.]